MNDFIVKNGLQLGGSVKGSVGSIAGAATLDLTSGNVFSYTPTANTTFVFSNPPASGTAYGFTLKVTGAEVTTAYDLVNASYDSVSFSVASQDAVPRAIAFNNDGTKMYIVGFLTQSVYQYSLSTAFNLATASYDSISFSVASQDFPSGLSFNNDGTKMYILGASTGSVYQYSLSTAFNLATASYDSVSFSVASQDSTPSELIFNNDGTKMYIVGFSTDSVYQYNLSTAFDLSTVSYDSVSFSVASQEAEPRTLTFNSDGTKMYVVGSSSDAVFQYTLSTGFDLSTASYDSVSFSVASQEVTASSVFFKPDGTKMYVVGSSSDAVFQYTTSTTAPATFTYPASVDWPAATAPDAPAVGETDVLVFYTQDGGTTYYGFQAGDALG